MRQTYRVLAYLVALGVVVQAASVALAWFITLKDVDDGQVFASLDDDLNVGHMMHSIGGVMVIPLIAIILFIISFFAGFDGAVKWAGYVLLAVILQVALAFIAFGVPAIGALHGLNAFLVMGLAGTAGSRVPKVDAAEPSETVTA